MTNIIYANWCLSDNFGDKLTPYLIEKMSDSKCIYVDGEEQVNKYMVCGSILNWYIKNCFVWGAGIANANDIIPKKNGIYATRGYISNEAAKNSGLKTYDIVGDPALVLPYIYDPRPYSNRIKKYKLSIIPHYVDLYTVIQKYPNYNIINLLDPIERIIDQIVQSEFIISSSLHRLIVADAYGVPNKWVKFTDKILGDDTKYHDYYTTTDKTDSCLDLRNETNYDLSSIEYSVKTFSKENLNKLLSVCPFNNKIKI